MIYTSGVLIKKPDFCTIHCTILCFDFKTILTSAAKRLIASKIKVLIYMIYVCGMCIYTYTHKHVYISEKNLCLYIKYIYLWYKWYEYKYIQVNTCKYFSKCMHVYIHNKYTQHTHIYYANKTFILYPINHLTALILRFENWYFWTFMSHIQLHMYEFSNAVEVCSVTQNPCRPVRNLK